MHPTSVSEAISRSQEHELSNLCLRDIAQLSQEAEQALHRMRRGPAWWLPCGSSRDCSGVTIFWDSQLVITSSVGAIHRPQTSSQRVPLASLHNGAPLPVARCRSSRTEGGAVRGFSATRPAHRARCGHRVLAERFSTPIRIALAGVVHERCRFPAQLQASRKGTHDTTTIGWSEDSARSRPYRLGLSVGDSGSRDPSRSTSRRGATAAALPPQPARSSRQGDRGQPR
jgi:hypothetical protein